MAASTKKAPTQIIESSDGRIQKMEVDFSSTVDEKIPMAENLAKVNYILILFFLRPREVSS